MGLTSILLVSSAHCPTCAQFKPSYMKLERKIKNLCNLYVVEAEHVGGRHALREGFAKHLESRYNGYPSLFILAIGDVKEIPYEIMWNKKLNRFDTSGIAVYVKEYLFERRLL